MFASFMPSLVGLYFLRKENQLKSLFSKFKVTPLLIAVYLFLPLTALLTSVILNIDLSIDVPTFFISFFVMLLIGGAIGEEFGWRGYVLPKLFKSHGVLKGTLILGILWSLWHLPLFYIDGTVQSNLPLWQFLLQNTMIAFFYSYIYLRTNGNIIMAILFHTVANWSSFIFPTFETTTGRFMNFGFLLVGLVIITVLDRNWYIKD